MDLTRRRLFPDVKYSLGLTNDIAAYRSASGSEVRRAGAVANNGIPHRPLIFATGLISTKADSG